MTISIDCTYSLSPRMTKKYQFSIVMLEQKLTGTLLIRQCRGPALERAVGQPADTQTVLPSAAMYEQILHNGRDEMAAFNVATVVYALLDKCQISVVFRPLASYTSLFPGFFDGHMRWIPGDWKMAKHYAKWRVSCVKQWRCTNSQVSQAIY